MGTRGCIARRTVDGFVGTYHGFDSYPTGLGKYLWQLFHGHFERDIHRMIKTLVDDHPAGWRSVDPKADWTQAPGFNDIGRRSSANPELDRPQCYCHGDRKERGDLFTQASCGAEYVYILDAVDGDPQMRVLANDGRDVGVRSALWGRELALVHFLDPEPDWEEIEEGRWTPPAKVTAFLSEPVPEPLSVEAFTQQVAVAFHRGAAISAETLELVHYIRWLTRGKHPGPRPSYGPLTKEELLRLEARAASLEALLREAGLWQDMPPSQAVPR